MRIRCYFKGYFDKGIKRGGALVCFYFKPKSVNAGPAVQPSVMRPSGLVWPRAISSQVSPVWR